MSAQTVTVDSVWVVSSAGSDNTYTRGDTIKVRIRFSARISVNQARVRLTMPSGNRWAIWETYSSSSYMAPNGVDSGKEWLELWHFVVQADADADGISIATDALDSGGGNWIIYNSDETAQINYAIPSNRAITNASGHKVDGAQGLPRPIGVSIASTPSVVDSTYILGDTINVEVAFDSVVSVVNTPQVALTIGSQTRQAQYASGTGNDTLVFRYAIVAADEDADGVSIGASALTLSTGDSIKTSGGTNAHLSLQSYAITNAGAHKVDGDWSLVVSGVEITSTPSLDSTYVLGDSIEVSVAFSASVAVTGTPQVALTIGTQTRQASYASGTGSSTLVFRYGVVAADTDTDGISIGASALALNSGTIRLGTINAALGLGTNAITNAGAHKVDGGWNPSVTGMAITSTPPSSNTYVSGDSIEVSVAFDANVDVTGTPQVALTIGTATRQAEYSSGSGSDTLVFHYRVVAADADADGISIGASALALNSGTIRTAAANATLGLGSNAITNSASHKVDGSQIRPPFVLDVNVSRSGPLSWLNRLDPADGDGMTSGMTVHVKVAFDRAMDVTGSPQVALSIASGTRQAEYASGTGTDTLEFRYLLHGYDTDNSGFTIGRNALTLNGGTIVAAGGTMAAALDLGTQRSGLSGQSARVWTTAGGPNSVTLSAPSSGDTYKLGDTIQVTVGFSRNWIGSTSFGTDVSLKLLVGSAERTVTNVGGVTYGQQWSSMDWRYVVAAEDMDADGISVPDDAISGGSVQPLGASDYPFSRLGILTVTNSAAHKVDGSQGPPGVSGVSIGAPLSGDTFERGDSILVTVTFNKPVDVTGSPQLALTIGTATKQAVYKSGTGTRSLVFGYEVVTADADTDGLSIGATALSLNGGTINMANGSVSAGLRVGAHAITNSSGHKVAGGTLTAPSVSGASITSTPAVATTYGRAEQIEVTVTFLRRVAVTTTGGTPQVALTIGTQTRQAAYVSGTGTKALLFRYTVVAADADANGIEVGASALTLNSGTINDARAGGSAASLGLGSHAISAASGHKVDGTLVGASAVHLTVTSSPAGAPDTYWLGEQIVVTLTFNLAVTVTGTPQLELTVGTTARQANYIGEYRFPAPPGHATPPYGPSVLSFAYRVQGEGSGGSGVAGEDWDADGIAVTALTLNGGRIVNAADGLRPATLGLGSLTISNPALHKVEGGLEDPPGVTNVDVTSEPGAGGLYGPRSTIRVTVTFDKPVCVEGASCVPSASAQVAGMASATTSARLAIEVGTQTRYAAYESGSGTTKLVFRYDVQASDRDSDGIVIPVDALESAANAIWLAGSSDPAGSRPTAASLERDLGELSNVGVTLDEHQVNGAGGTDPTFGALEYEFELTEEVAGPVVLGQVSATDPLGGGVTYSLSAGGEGLFEVDAETGTLTYVGTGEDAEVRSEFVMTVRATSADGEGRTGEVAVTVRLLNVNDPPAFTAERYEFGFAENEAGPLSLGAVEAVDLDEGDTLTYRMATGDADRFDLNIVTGEVRYVGAGEDYEGAGPKAWELQVEATDLAGLVATATVTVTLSNVNESPAFADSAYAFELAENAHGPLSLGTVHATDPDRGDWLSYALAEGDAERFKVKATNGAVQYVGAGEDAETGPDSWALVVTATDRSGLAAQTRVVVTLEDRNERPTFAAPNYEWELAEHQAGPVTLGAVEATDVDAGDSLVYRLSGAGAALFEVDGAGGVVQYVGAGEDAETGPQGWEFEVVATDRGGLAAVAKATVKLLDVNEAPVFVDAAYAFDFAENVSGPRDLGRVEATDPDRNETLTYSLASGDAARFEVDGATGAVRYVGGGEDYEASPPTFALAVRVTDTGGLTAEAAVEVALLNVNEGPEAVGSLSPPALEASGAPWEVDLGAYFRDPDGDALTYAAESSSPSVASATVTGAGRLSVRPGEIGTAVVTVTASDVGGLSATQQASVLVDGSRTERARALKLTLAAFGRSLGTETVDAIGGRLGLESSGGSALGRSHVQLGGRSLNCATAAATSGAGGPAGTNGATSGGQCGLESLLRDASGLLGFHLTHPGSGAGADGSGVGGSGGTLDLAALLLAFRDAGAGGGGLAHSSGLGTNGSPQGPAAESASRDAPQRGTLAFSPVTGRDIRSRSSFQLSFGGSAGDASSGEDGVSSTQATSLARWTLWGQSNYGEFEGRPDEGFSMDGRTYSVYAGLDYRLDSGFLVGLAGSRSDLAANYESAINGASRVDAHLNSLYPYASWSSDDGLGVWGVVGAGRGAAVLGEQNRGFHAVLNMRMGALGVRQELTDGLALKADAFAVRMNTAESPGGVIAPVTATAQRIRLAPELGRQWTVADGVAVRTRLELGARFDGGDAETGMGAEAGGEFGLTHDGIGLSLAARGRALLVHQESDFKDWGAALSLRIQPGRSGAGADPGSGASGLSFSLEPSWGDASGSAQTLWQGGDDVWRNAGMPALGATTPTTHGAPDGSDTQDGSATQGLPPALGFPAARTARGWTPDRLAMEMGYGLSLPDGSHLRPFGRWSREGPAGYRLNVGTQWALLGTETADDNPGGLQMVLDVFGEQAANGLMPPERRVGLLGRITF